MWLWLREGAAKLFFNLHTLLFAEKFLFQHQSCQEEWVAAAAGESQTLSKIGNQSLVWESAKLACKVVFCCLHHWNARSYFCVWFFFPTVLLKVQRLFVMPEKDCLKTQKIRLKLQLTNLYKTYHDFGHSQTIHFDSETGSDWLSSLFTKYLVFRGSKA